MSDMAANISPGNKKVNPEIFLPGMLFQFKGLLRCGMGKKPQPTEPNIHLGAWLDELGVKVIDAAEMAGCSQSYLSNIIRNAKRRPNVHILLQLSTRLGLTVNDLYEPVPSRNETARFANLSPRARETLLEHRRRAG